jgi:hypothetical protein
MTMTSRAGSELGRAHWLEARQEPEEKDKGKYDAPPLVFGERRETGGRRPGHQSQDEHRQNQVEPMVPTHNP